LKIIKLISIVLALLLTMACNKESGGGPSSPASSPPSGSMMQHPPLAPGGGTISGTISIDPPLASKVTETNVIYITARSADMPGPPMAAQKLENIRFPYHYTLSSADLMMQGGNFQGRVNIVVRLDRDGAAGPPQPGDMEGVYSGNPATVGDQKVDVVINKEF
jgi:cytochrome c-type biogenesis protein CcmH